LAQKKSLPTELRRRIKIAGTSQSEQQVIRKIRLQRLDLLFEYYGIRKSAKESWRELAFRMAIEMFPGLQLARKAGRHKRWKTNADELKLFALVEDARKQRGNLRKLTAREGIKKVINEFQKISSGMKVSSALVQYHRTKRKLRDRSNLQRFLAKGPVRAFAKKEQVAK
jgi:hypothetical protein